MHISDEALEAAAKLSSRYVTDRFLTDKAIDLVDEAASRVRMYKSQSAENSKDLIAELRELRKQLKEARARGDNDVVEELLDRQSMLEDRLQEMQNGWDRSSAPDGYRRGYQRGHFNVQTGIPLTQLATEESERLLHMEEELSKHIIGQEEAIQTISKVSGGHALA